VAWDVSQQLATLASRPLLLWHGDEDDVVPPGDLPLAAGAAAKRLADNLTCLWQKGVRHRITPEALAATVAFFSAPLNANHLTP
jgi:fermentation-respiration switch protein FrsA (DUF1100 family)